MTIACAVLYLLGCFREWWSQRHDRPAFLFWQIAHVVLWPLYAAIVLVYVVLLGDNPMSSEDD